MSEKFLPLDYHKRLVLLELAGVDWHSKSEFCNIQDNELCNVAKGKKVGKGTVGYQCQTKLDSICVKKLCTKEIGLSEDKISSDTVRGHVMTIRSKILESKSPLKFKSSQMDFAGQHHYRPHRRGYLCGYCLIYKRKGPSGKGLPGWALAAKVKWEPIPEKENIQRKVDELLKS